MRIPILALALAFASSSAGLEADPVLSTEQMTKDQRDIYRDFLTFSKSPKSLHFVIDRTLPFEDRGSGECLKGFEDLSASGTIHRLGGDLFQHEIVRLVPLGTKIQFPRRDARGRTVKDPDLVTSILSLSEVVFNRKHDRAALAYGIGCGPHCGAGWVVLYEFRDGKWNQSKQCPTWIS